MNTQDHTTLGNTGLRGVEDHLGAVELDGEKGRARERERGKKEKRT